jgi:hypothetical protein
MAVAKTLGYYDMAKATTVESSVMQAPGVIKHFGLYVTLLHNQLVYDHFLLP